MMPNAKMVSLLRFPPEKRSRKPSSEPACVRKMESSASKLMPGTGTWPPIRYTARSAKVYPSLFLRSGMLKMFLMLSMKPSAGQDLHRSARRLDLSARLGAEPVRLDLQSGRRVTPSQNDQSIQDLVDDAG